MFYNEINRRLNPPAAQPKPQSPKRSAKPYQPVPPQRAAQAPHQPPIKPNQQRPNSQTPPTNSLQ